jgi:hypothetical protein
MTDKGEPGSSDTIGITIWNKSGGLWFASNWNGTKTVEQTLAAGNLKVYKALQAAGGESLPSADGPSALTQEMLSPIVAEALTRWRDAGADPNLMRPARETVWQIADLPGADLGQASAAGVILLDRDAAGYGWFIDFTPWESSEFALKQGEWIALSGAAAGRIDLLTVVMHELGHVLDLADLVSPADAGDLMYETLAVGTRHTECRLMVPQAMGRFVESWHYSRTAFAGSWYSEWLKELGFLA